MFKNGGWLYSPTVLTFTFIFTLISVIKLIDSANKVQIYNYGELVEHALGRRYAAVLRLAEGLMSFFYILPPLAFFMKTLYSFFRLVTGHDHDKVIYIYVSILFFAPIVWVRRVEIFRVTYILAILCTVYLYITVSSILVVEEIQTKDWEPAAGVKPFNIRRFINMWANSYYIFDGVGRILPILEQTETNNFKDPTKLAMFTILIANIIFGELCYHFYGDSLTEFFVTEMPPLDQNIFMLLGKLAMCSYILTQLPFII